MAARTTLVPQHALGSLALGLICAGGLFTGIAAASPAHAATSMTRVHPYSSMNHGSTRIAQGAICLDCGRFGPFAHVHPDPNGHPWSARPRIVPDPSGQPWRQPIRDVIHRVGHGKFQPDVNPQPLPPRGEDSIVSLLHTSHNPTPAINPQPLPPRGGED